MIEIGEYVRTKKGIIDKIKTINRYGIITKYDDKDDKISSSINYYFNDGLEIDEEDIVKHSKNIIDLLEVGDIVEIELSEEFVEKENKKVLTQIGEVYTKETLQKDIDNGIITKILTILTKEQMEANQYYVEKDKRI